MARFESNPSRLVIRMAGCVALLGMTTSASAQINERDRLERCANNRAQMVALQRQWPAASSGWPDDMITRARNVLQQLEILRRRAYSRYFDYDPDGRLELIEQMAQMAAPFEARCFPVGSECAQVLVDELGRLIREAEEGRGSRQARIATLEREFARYRTNYIALGCDRVSGTEGGQVGPTTRPEMSGTFETTFGRMTLSPGGGSYDYYGGQVQVSAVTGGVMEGIWTQTRAGRQCPDGRYYGRFRFEFTSSGFTGSFGYCDDPPGAGVWNGTRR